MPELAASHARRAASKFSLLSASLSGHSARYLKFPLSKKTGLLFGKAAALGSDFALPAPGSHAFGEIILASVGAFRRVIVGLLTIGEADLLPFRACLVSGEGRRCRYEDAYSFDKGDCSNPASHDGQSFNIKRSCVRRRYGQPNSLNNDVPRLREITAASGI
jgi:hypothetical protein